MCVKMLAHRSIWGINSKEKLLLFSICYAIAIKHLLGLFHNSKSEFSFCK